MKVNDKQLNWIMGQIEQTGYLSFDDIRNYYNDGKLSAKHLTSAKKSVNYLIKSGWIKKKKGLLVFTADGRRWWVLNKHPKLIKMMIEKELDVMVTTWNVWASKTER